MWKPIWCDETTAHLLAFKADHYTGTSYTTKNFPVYTTKVLLADRDFCNYY